jgi:hypothetical protein
MNGSSLSVLNVRGLDMPADVARDVFGYVLDAERGRGLRCPFCGAVLMLNASCRRRPKSGPCEGDWLLSFICAECMEFATPEDSGLVRLAAKSAFWLSVGELVQGEQEVSPELQERVLAALGVSFPGLVDGEVSSVSA